MTKATIRTAESALLDQLSEDRHQIRSAIAIKPKGSASSIHHTRRGANKNFPASRSVRTNCAEATARKMVTTVATALVKMREAGRRFSGIQVCSSVESASKRPSRAAIAPPNIPTSKTACWTIEVEAGIPTRSVRRKSASASGISTMPANTRLTIKSSRRRTKTRPSRRCEIGDSKSTEATALMTSLHRLTRDTP